MTAKRAFFPPSSRLLVGSAVLIVAAGLTYGQWYSIEDSLDTLAWYDQHRAPGDSAGYSSAAYHASHSQETYASRWKPTGYATLGSLGAIIGLGLIFAGLARRPVSFRSPPNGRV